MIDWDRTYEVYGYQIDSRISKKSKVVLKCDECGVEKYHTKHYHYRAVRRTGHYRCRKCADIRLKITSKEAIKKKWRDPEYRAKQEARTHSDKLKDEARSRSLMLWQNKEYVEAFRDGFDPNVARLNFRKAGLIGASKQSLILRSKWVDDEYKFMMAARSFMLWRNADYRKSVVDGLISHYQLPENRALASDRAHKAWDNIISRSKLSEAIKTKWNDPDYRNKCIASSSKRSTSSYEDIVSKVLDGYDVDYERQYVIGPWSFDFVIHSASLLIEVNGYYYHSKRKSLDKAKATYVNRHTDFKLIVLEESDLLAEYKLKSLFERSVSVVDVKFNELIFEQCKRDEVLQFIAAFHYMGKPKRGGRYFKVVYNGELIAALIASSLHREQIAISIGADPKTSIEIARFVIHPKYQVKNLASWTIARFRKWAISHNKKTIIAFADTSLHSGTIYLAAGFVNYGVSRTSDYEYSDKDGFRLHKKTVWDAAKKNSMSEKDYANAMSLSVIRVAPRSKFVWR